MITSILIPGAIGFVWGFAVSLFNNYLTYRALNNPKGKLSSLFFALRQGIIILAMFLVYKNTAMLIGTALGLLVIKNYIFIKGLKEINVQKRKG